MILSASDDLERAIVKIGNGNPGAAVALVELVARCRSIDPKCDHPFGPLIQLDHYKITGPFFYAMYADLCDADMVRLLALLRWAEMGRLKPSLLRAAITHKMGRHLAPPWFRPVDPVLVLAHVRTHYPTFGDVPQ